MHDFAFEAVTVLQLCRFPKTFLFPVLNPDIIVVCEGLRTLKDLWASSWLSLPLDKGLNACKGLFYTAISYLLPPPSVRGNLIKSTDFSKGQLLEPTQLIKWVTPLLFVALCSPFLIWVARRNPLAGAGLDLHLEKSNLASLL